MPGDHVTFHQAVTAIAGENPGPPQAPKTLQANELGNRVLFIHWWNSVCKCMSCLMSQTGSREAGVSPTQLLGGDSAAFIGWGVGGWLCCAPLSSLGKCMQTGLHQAASASVCEGASCRRLCYLLCARRSACMSPAPVLLMSSTCRLSVMKFPSLA